jgi:hypothetical protein
MERKMENIEVLNKNKITLSSPHGGDKECKLKDKLGKNIRTDN